MGKHKFESNFIMPSDPITDIFLSVIWHDITFNNIVTEMYLPKFIFYETIKSDESVNLGLTNKRKFKNYIKNKFALNIHITK